MNSGRSYRKSKYDTEQSSLSSAYGEMADIRRVIGDSPENVKQRVELLEKIANTKGQQQTWIFMDDYFRLIHLTHREFADEAWWEKILSIKGRARLEEIALQFCRSDRSLPSELEDYVDYDRLDALLEGEKTTTLAEDVEEWLFPRVRPHLDAPTSSFVAVLDLCPSTELNAHLSSGKAARFSEKIIAADNEFFVRARFLVSRPRLGNRFRTMDGLRDLKCRAAHERELFPTTDWDFLEWILAELVDEPDSCQEVILVGKRLHYWLTEWGEFGVFVASASDIDCNAERAGVKRDGVTLHFANRVVRLGAKVLRAQSPNADPSFLENLPSSIDPGDPILYRFLQMPDGGIVPLDKARLICGTPRFVISGKEFFLLTGTRRTGARSANTPQQTVPLGNHFQKPALPLKCFSGRFIRELCRSNYASDVPWSEICTMHKARPRFVMELCENAINVRLYAYCSVDGVEERPILDSTAPKKRGRPRVFKDTDEGKWLWTGKEWEPITGDNLSQKAVTVGKDIPSNLPKKRGRKKRTDDDNATSQGCRLEYLEDERLDRAVAWLSKFDWFTPERGLWVVDATESFFEQLAMVWDERPQDAEYFGNAGFQQLFLNPHRLRPRVIIRGSGIDWLSVSTEWEQEGLHLSPADLERLAISSSRFVKLPDAGWVELDVKSLLNAQETLASLGVDKLTSIDQKVSLMNAAMLSPENIASLDGAGVAKLKERIAQFNGIPQVALPQGIQVSLRNYQYDGFNFLCFLTQMRTGGILADDMGLGKTLQALSWLLWLKKQSQKTLPKGQRIPEGPSLVVCPASVLHNWARECRRFTPDLSVLIVESFGEVRHNLPKLVPNYDLVVINYSMLRRELQDLAKTRFVAVVLDEAQYIKNPLAQITHAVKQLKSQYRVALTGTPLENSLLDLWSITDFVCPNYLGNQHFFSEHYSPHDASEEVQSIARRKLSAKLRPILLRRLKTEVAKDLPERIEERRDCELTDSQRQLYLAELRRSRELIQKTVQEKGLAKSKMHVLAALTRLRQICCHPRLVGNDATSGKIDTLFELLEALQSEGQKVLVFSQFVEMLKILQHECDVRGIKTHILTGVTKDRKSVVEAFQTDPNPSIFLLSLRAAGTGLNLTAASYVVLYDPWWNPSVEAQAIDRTHRIGQTSTVNAYRLISPGTVEEKIWELQQKKSKTISAVLGEQGFERSLTAADLDYLFSE